MQKFNRKNHWENIYNTKKLNEVSWYQPTPKTSLELIKNQQPTKNSQIIDIGGGDSFLVDHLISLGYENLSVLDISSKAIDRAQERLGANSKKVNWITSDVVEFKPETQYDIWHDRAAFHFLTNTEDIDKYIALSEKHLSQNGFLIIGTFSKNGPTKCSGIEIKQYSIEDLEKLFSDNFNLMDSHVIEHPTPFDTIQEFVFCVLQKK